MPPGWLCFASRRRPSRGFATGGSGFRRSKRRSAAADGDACGQSCFRAAQSPGRAGGAGGGRAARVWLLRAPFARARQTLRRASRRRRPLPARRSSGAGHGDLLRDLRTRAGPLSEAWAGPAGPVRREGCIRGFRSSPACRMREAGPVRRAGRAQRKAGSRPSGKPQRAVPARPERGATLRHRPRPELAMIFITLLLPTFLVALLTSFIVARLFNRPVGVVLQRLVGDPLHLAWQRYVIFAIFVVGLSSGVELHKIEAYLQPIAPAAEAPPLPPLNADRIALEIYRTVIATVQGIAWMLLLVFLVLLIAYAIVRSSELKAAAMRPRESSSETAAGERPPAA